MLKQGSRAQFWHERYFRFTPDHRLEYSVGPSAPAKAALRLTELAELKVSELYVARHKQSLVYCVKLAWTCDGNNNPSDSLYDPFDQTSHPGGEGAADDDDDTSYYGHNNPAHPGSSRPLPPSEDPDVLSGVSESVASAAAATTEDGRHHRAGRRTPLDRLRRRHPPSQGVGGGVGPGGRSVDQESITLGSRRRHRGRPPARREGGGSLDGDDPPLVPVEVEVDPRHMLPPHPERAAAAAAQAAAPPPPAPRSPLVRGASARSSPPPPAAPSPPPVGTPPSPARRSHRRAGSSSAAAAGGGGGGDPPPPSHPRARTEYERQRDEDLEFLKSEFLTRQQERRKVVRRRVRTGTKIAVAAGAAVGVTVVTAGIGLVAGLVFLGVGAAAGGGSAAAAVAAALRSKVRGELVLASSDYDAVRMWKAVLDASKDSDSIKRSTWGQLFVSGGRNTHAALLPRTLVFARESHRPDLGGGRGEQHPTLSLGERARWVPLEGGWISVLGGGHGLRIFREDDGGGGAAASASAAAPGPAPTSNPVRTLLRRCCPEGGPCAPMKAHAVINTSPIDAFLCLMSLGRVNAAAPGAASHVLEPVSEQSTAFCVVESIDDHADIIHLVFRPLYLVPTWTSPRDFCLFRYWRLEQDGSYMVCYESTEHPRCPPSPLYVRGEMHQVVTIAPQKISYRRRMQSSKSAPSSSNSAPPVDCLMTAVAQVDPKGWVPTKQLSFLSDQGYADAFTIMTLSRVREVRDAIDQDRFMPVFVDPGEPAHLYGASSLLENPSLEEKNSLDELEDDGDDTPSYDYAYAYREASRRTPSGAELDLVLFPPPLCPEKWAEPDSNSFRVRGPSYKADRLKVNAGESIGRLVAVDVVWSESPIYSGFSAHPGERMQMALRKERHLVQRGRPGTLPPFVFVVTIILPGPPYYYGVYYFAVDDRSAIDGSDGTPSSKLCSQFFFGESDEFRDRTFKLIPQIVQGNFIVRKAVGSTPAIMGTKLRQLYVRGERSFEVILDCGSDAVATGVIGLSLSYAKTLVIDMGFLFEGDDPSTLPERMFGAVRMKQPEFGPHLRKVDPPPPPRA
jgi:hypothetical protein